MKRMVFIILTSVSTFLTSLKTVSRKLAHWSLVSLILKEEKIQDIIYQQLARDRNQLIDEEDLEVMKSSGYVL